MTSNDAAGVAADDQIQAEARLGVAILYPIFRSIVHGAPDLAMAKQQAVEALRRVDRESPWTPDELMHALVESFAMLYKAETSATSRS